MIFLPHYPHVNYSARSNYTFDICKEYIIKNIDSNIKLYCLHEIRSTNIKRNKSLLNINTTSSGDLPLFILSKFL